MPTVTSHSEQETMKIAEAFAKTLEKGDVVLLDGNMGAGKTVFVKGIAKGLGIEVPVTSPTYTYVNTYGSLYHFDCYRIRSERHALELGLADYFDCGGICLVEWGENIKGLLPQNCKRVTISGSGEEMRTIEL